MSDFENRSRRLARERYWKEHPKEEYECPDCGRGRGDIVGEFQVHHKSENPHDNRLDRLVGLCGFCHRLREGKKPSLERIKRYREHQQPSKPEPQRQPDQPRIYTAGRMVWHNNEDSSYRASVEARSDIDAELMHPQDTYFDHGGDSIAGCVAEDIGLIDRADGIVSLFEETGQTGTMVETIHAAANGVPALVLISNDLLAPPAGPAPHHQGRTQWIGLPHKLAGMGQRAESPLWFLVNYLIGDSTTGRGYSHDSPVDDWGGTNTTVAAVAKGDGSIGDALRSWVENDLNTIDSASTSADLKRVAKEVADPRWSDE
jgi:nucleoside 2-deoxyribosyltransferase